MLDRQLIFTWINWGWKMLRDELTKGEKFVFDWQFRLSGSFTKNLAITMSLADIENRIKLSESYPEEMQAMTDFQNKEGWWDDVIKRSGIRKMGSGF